MLFGFYQEENKGYIIAAYDPAFHQKYSYSKSLQIKFSVIENALHYGIAFYPRKNNETVAVFHIDNIVSYFENKQYFHQLNDDEVASLDAIIAHPDIIGELDSDSTQLRSAPELSVQKRRKSATEIVRFIRNHNFAKGIREVYDCCAICGFQYDYIMDAAHIVPVAEGGTDTYENGLGLCPNCHRMYDKGQILVTGDRKSSLIPIKQRYLMRWGEQVV